MWLQRETPAGSIPPQRHGKPQTQVNAQVNIDADAITQQAIDRLFSKYDASYVPGSA